MFQFSVYQESKNIPDKFAVDAMEPLANGGNDVAKALGHMNNYGK